MLAENEKNHTNELRRRHSMSLAVSLFALSFQRVGSLVIYTANA